MLEDQRRAALDALARLESKEVTAALIAHLGSLDHDAERWEESVGWDLSRLLTSLSPAQLASRRDEIRRLAPRARRPLVRQLGFASLLLADASVEKAWALALSSTRRLRDLVGSMPHLPDASLRSALYPLVEPFLEGLPGPLAKRERPSKGTVGRYVRIEPPGPRGTLTLAEVEVLSDGRNVARQGKASQKNTGFGGDPARALDGNKSGVYGENGQTHSQQDTADPWWEADLGEELPIESISIWNRTEGSLGQRLDGFTLLVLDEDRSEVLRREKRAAPRPMVTIETGGGGAGASLRRAAMEALTYVRGKEVETIGRLARFVREERDATAAVRALRRVPRSYWTPEEAAPVVESIIAQVSRVPEAERTSRAVVGALQLAGDLAATLAAPEAAAVRKRLSALGVRIVRIGTVPHQMIYDRDYLAVAAGRQVEFLFENSDNMPHNFVVTQPGALEEIGMAAEAGATAADALARHYVPRSKKILLSSRLLQPTESQRLGFRAPRKPGVYPYVCTYPGHWRRMFGALFVVEDLPAYLADPEAYLTAHALPVEDELLQSRRPRKDWKLADLAPSLGEIDAGRVFGNAKQIFEVATCAACHRLNGVGQEFGPDLTKLDPKWTREEILRHMLEPSWVINEQYSTWSFVTTGGDVISGLLVKETPATVSVVENPLTKTEPTELAVSEVLQREKSPTSIMPEGLLSRLTREEILDLVAYVEARGDPGNRLFRGPGSHAHHHVAGGEEAAAGAGGGAKSAGKVLAPPPPPGPGGEPAPAGSP